MAKKDDLSGWGGDEGDDDERIHITPQTFVLFAANVVLLLWAASGVVGVITGNYRMMELVTPIMGVLAAYLFGKPIVDRLRNGHAN